MLNSNDNVAVVVVVEVRKYCAGKMYAVHHQSTFILTNLNEIQVVAYLGASLTLE